MGGPTFGIDQGENSPLLCARAWRALAQGGYDKLGRRLPPGPRGGRRRPSRLALAHLRAHAQRLWRTPPILPRPRRWTALLASALTPCGRREEGDSARTPSPKDCWWPNARPFLAALGWACHTQGRPYGSCGPHRDPACASSSRWWRTMADPLQGHLCDSHCCVRRAWKGTVRPRYSTRQQGTRRCRAANTEMVCVHGALAGRGGRARRRALPLVAERGVNAQVRDGRRRSPLLIGSSSKACALAWRPHLSAPRRWGETADLRRPARPGRASARHG
jgi:hypothetical protein